MHVICFWRKKKKRRKNVNNEGERKKTASTSPQHAYGIEMKTSQHLMIIFCIFWFCCFFLPPPDLSTSYKWACMFERTLFWTLNHSIYKNYSVQEVNSLLINADNDFRTSDSLPKNYKFLRKKADMATFCLVLLMV